MDVVAQPTRQALVQAAQSDLQKGFYSVVLKKGEKRPASRGWMQSRHGVDQLPHVFSSGANRGRLMGAPASPSSDGTGWSAAVDLDLPEAVSLAPSLLPQTGEIAGRVGSGRSHYFYWTDAPLPTRRFRDTDGHMMLELLSTGSQIVVCPSVHPSGEPYQWWEDGSASHLSGSELFLAVTDVAAAVLLLRTLPRKDWRRALVGAEYDEGRIDRVLSALDVHPPHAPLNPCLSVAAVSGALSVLAGP